MRERGHNAYSSDILQSDDDSPYHLIGDARQVLREEAWDLLIAHPPCTYLCNSGVRWLTTIPRQPKPGILYGRARWEGMEEAIELFEAFLHCDIPRVCVENPVMHRYARNFLGSPTQWVHPYLFGHQDTKQTGLWLRGLPLLTPTLVMPHRRPDTHWASPSPDRGKIRSLTCEGMAYTMARQWA